ncbi:MAG TPA: PKD domain-containing protein [Gemmatimonadota bacterium]|nr:PKD domain-containing protein [Gemmatimonadota bacterium]
MHRSPWGALAALLFAALLACGDTSAPPTGTPPAADDGTGTVTPAGGTVTLGTEVGVIVPAGAVAEPVTITIERVATPAVLQGSGAIGQAYRFSPAGQLFAAPVEVFVFVPQAALTEIDPNSVALDLTVDPSGAPAPAGVERLAAIRREAVSGGVKVHGATSHFSIISATAQALPTADAGPDRTVSLGVAVEVIGIGTDPAGGPVTLDWSLIDRPAGSAASLAQSAAEKAVFTPDVSGAYLLRLTVTNSNGTPVADEVTITAVQAAAGAPIAEAGDDRRVAHGIVVTLDGSASTGDAPLSFAWRFLSFPSSRPPLLNATTTTPSFAAQTGGTHVVELTVTNDHGSGTDTVTITVNSLPIPHLSAPGGVLAGAQVTLIDGSTDPDGDPLTASWTLTSPAGSAATLIEEPGRATFRTDVTGFYDVDLTVSDGLNSAAVQARVAAVPDVSGVYTSTFVIDPAPACGLEAEAVFGPQDLTITQAGDRVTFRLSEITDGQASDFTGPVRPDGSFDFVASMQVVHEGETFTLSPRWTGRFLPSGELDARFSVSVLSCQITGSLAGTRL